MNIVSVFISCNNIISYFHKNVHLQIEISEERLKMSYIANNCLRVNHTNNLIKKLVAVDRSLLVIYHTGLKPTEQQLIAFTVKKMSSSDSTLDTLSNMALTAR